MSTLRACRHLNHKQGSVGPDIELCCLDAPLEHVIYWKRGPSWTDAGPGEKPNPMNVQFCGKGRGRINSIFDCYDGSTGICYDPQEGA